MKTFVNFILAMSAVYFVLSIAIINGFGVTVVETPVSRGRVASASVVVPDKTGVPIIDNINTIRINSGISPLLVDVNLNKVADTRAKDMISNNYYSHIDQSGNDYTHLLAKKSSFSCENLDLSSENSPDAIITDWLDSTSGHKECLLDSRATKVGISTKDYGVIQSNGNSTFVSVLILSN